MTRRLAHTVFGSALAICLLSGAASVVTWRPVIGAAPPAVQDQEPVVLVGAGDIANCDVNGGSGAVATAALLDRIPGTVFTVGDHAYPSGTTKEFQDCYDTSWGRHKARTRPAPGNHDYLTANAKGYTIISATARAQIAAAITATTSVPGMSSR